MDDKPPRASKQSAERTGAVAPRPEARAVSVQSDGARAAVAAPRLEALSRAVLRSLRVKHALLSITFVAPRAMATINRKHLGHRGPTDVITFALGTDPNGVVLADIYICPDVARAQAREHGVGVREEIARLVVHGTLHACGWEHPEGEERTTSPMWRRQEQLLARFWTSPAARE
jgi:probable rRNA maturation factor